MNTCRLVPFGAIGNSALETQRNGKFLPQYCPTQTQTEFCEARCGDWCPLLEVNTESNLATLHCSPNPHHIRINQQEEK